MKDKVSERKNRCRSNISDDDRNDNDDNTMPSLMELFTYSLIHYLARPAPH